MNDAFKIENILIFAFRNWFWIQNKKTSYSSQFNFNKCIIIIMMKVHCLNQANAQAVFQLWTVPKGFQWGK